MSSGTHTAAESAAAASPTFTCGRAGGANYASWAAAYAQQAVRGVLHVLCAVLPFPLTGDPSVLWKRSSASGSHQHTAPHRLHGPPGGTGFAPDRVVSNKDFGALTRGAATLEDAIGSSYESSTLCVLIAHSELSSDSVRLVRELHDLVDHHGSIGDAERTAGEAAAVNVDEEKYRHAWRTLAHDAHTYVLSMFSVECSFIPALHTCSAPAVLVYAPVEGASGLTRVGVLMGPVSLQDVVKMVDECQAKWAVCPVRWK
jgi:hypothetical protein